MQIHVVSQGESLYKIGNIYGVPYEQIAEVNELESDIRLAVGQALVIPIIGSYYWVRPGDSLYTIAQKYGLTVARLAEINAIDPTRRLMIGQRLYIPQEEKTLIDSLLYVEPRNPVSQDMLAEVRDRVDGLTYLAMFSYEVQRDGSLKAPALADIPTIAKNAGVVNMLVVTNLEDYSFSADLAHVIFTNQAAQNQMIQSAIEIAKEIGYGDIHFDFELLFPEDRELYNQLLRNARDQIHKAGLTISTALAPKAGEVTTGIYGAHDYKVHGEIVDFVVLMTYEWGYTYSAPQAVSPIGPVTKVVEYAVSQIPNEKVFLGQNLYGYDWTAPFGQSDSKAARALSPRMATNLAIEQNVAIEYDALAQAPHYTYYDEQGTEHAVWFEDARSINEKFNLLKKFKLRGIMYWKLGLAFPQNWLLLEDRFTIRKL
ncbi:MULTISPECIES: LysM peptidoglycan-binding domain-containing protein [unclassified Sporosarcina]|uniref:LysM peptidoglycan-binding domain-containing protein n=1 Tax=unclassified Sporosarcina TaxID=2647733 RepID=UPI000C165321|nr:MULTISPECIES: LysM peptidoglycan-binding domain-containing protein [unclassified Sporosarcina]PID00921.1 spore gernimation protein [Sporosarcina sp. P29]PID07021.1 spore gernimation protein [Sporosarcina sp. P30]PID10217.1 spore gernimation protein [Sporosarcina sp. P31]PID12115.1 spore gernimation protein [Sporosarcina sp. P32b]